MANNEKNLRRCIVCRQHSDKSGMIRIAKIKDGNIFVDTTGKSGGRGVWVHDSAECKKQLIKKRLLNAAFKCAVDDSVYEGIAIDD